MENDDLERLYACRHVIKVMQDRFRWRDSSIEQPPIDDDIDMFYGRDRRWSGVITGRCVINNGTLVFNPAWRSAVESRWNVMCTFDIQQSYWRPHFIPGEEMMIAVPGGLDV